MIILIFLTLFLALPFITGLYYISTGIARKRRNVTLTGLFLVLAWCTLMFFIYNDLYTVFAKGE